MVVQVNHSFTESVLKHCGTSESIAVTETVLLKRGRGEKCREISVLPSTKVLEKMLQSISWLVMSHLLVTNGNG